MNGILGEVGKVLIELQENGAAVIEKTEELYVDEILYYVEETLKGVKAEYKVEVLQPDQSSKITLQ
ncbi:hypothetical protein C2I17_17445 [Niallia circulans]|uniref:hypothetical protein n=1 Tax=Niallia circulans TaxID=1397 RepID=UPI00201E7078|nr:hypothetical protein [Niallia circulans]UQZ76198.1 hypothetical protein C2I17_17445 [Niallia circulans]